MKIWLVTTGSSDVQLKTDDYWNDWYRGIKRDCHSLPFKPARVIQDSTDPYRIAPRVLGMAYQKYSDEIWDALEFPLLKEFTAKLKDEAIDQIVLLLTDQCPIFDESQRGDRRCPYWQDTCELRPVFERYFQQHFPNTEVVVKVLAPQENESGLDDWNFVLDLVRSSLKEIVGEPTTVYVSHQAGTPAISSAVQFCSLARFRKDVEFLVSSEYRPEQTRTISRSTYLRGIQIQEARALLDRYDYSQVKALLTPYLETQNPEHKRMQTLLKAAIEWNHAEFHKFKNILTNGGVISKESFPWWRLGYESAYLAVVRLQQGSTVEALFHSFRAVEGSTIQWAKNEYKKHLVETHPRSGLQIKLSICDDLPGYLNALSDTSRDNFKKWGKIGLFGVPLYELLKQAKPHWRSNPNIAIVWDSAKEKRNAAFHNIDGLQEDEVYSAWDTKTSAEWKARVLGCLNFISGEAFGSFEVPETNGKSASLMVKVHRELVEAIAQL